MFSTAGAKLAVKTLSKQNFIDRSESKAFSIVDFSLNYIIFSHNSMQFIINSFPSLICTEVLVFFLLLLPYLYRLVETRDFVCITLKSVMYRHGAFTGACTVLYGESNEE